MDHDALTAQFVAVTGSKASDAEGYLTSANWNLEEAVATYFAAQDGGADDEAPAAAPAEPEYTGPRTLDGRPAPESRSAAATAAASKSKSKQPPRRGIATLGSLGQGSSHAGHGHDDDDDDDDYSDSDPEQPRDLYAGGEKSGLSVQDPTNKSKKGASARAIADEIEKKAREQSKQSRREEAEAPTRSSRFTGSGMTLGGDGVESRVIPDPNARRAPEAPPERRILHLWNDGFSIEDGPLHRFDDPANASDLAMINQGRAPIHLMNVQYGQAVDVALHRHDTDYVKPKTVYKPFSGGGQRLGSPVPGGDVSTATTTAAPSASSAQSSSASAPPTVEVDSSQPTINLRIQLADGTRLPARFNTTHTVGDIYDFVSRASPSTGREWVIATTFPNKEHTDKSQVLGEMAEFKKGGTAVQKWK